MENNTANSKAMNIVGWIFTILPSLLLIFSGIGKLVKPAGMEESIAQLGWGMDKMTAVGILELACVAIYLVPRTSILGAILLTGYMGGATATHVRVDDPFFMTVVVGMVIWLGIWLREPRLRTILPFRN